MKQTSKIIKIVEKMSKKPCFHWLFWILFILGAILARQTSNSVFSGPWHLLTPQRPLGPDPYRISRQYELRAFCSDKYNVLVSLRPGILHCKKSSGNLREHVKSYSYIMICTFKFLSTPTSKFSSRYNLGGNMV